MKRFRPSGHAVTPWRGRVAGAATLCFFLAAGARAEAQAGRPKAAAPPVPAPAAAPAAAVPSPAPPIRVMTLP
jgi:hypothetical protein